MNIQLKNSKGTVIPITISIQGYTLTIISKNLLTKGTKYTVTTHTGSVTDLSR